MFFEGSSADEKVDIDIQSYRIESTPRLPRADWFFSHQDRANIFHRRDACSCNCFQHALVLFVTLGN